MVDNYYYVPLRCFYNNSKSLENFPAGGYNKKIMRVINTQFHAQKVFRVVLITPGMYLVKMFLFEKHIVIRSIHESKVMGSCKTFLWQEVFFFFSKVFILLKILLLDSVKNIWIICLYKKKHFKGFLLILITAWSYKNINNTFNVIKHGNTNSKIFLFLFFKHTKLGKFLNLAIRFIF